MSDAPTVPPEGGGSLERTPTQPIQESGKPESATPDNNPSTSEQEPGSGDPEEQALESHEVIELQTFSERKAWIEEKIKVLPYLSLSPITAMLTLYSSWRNCLQSRFLPVSTRYASPLKTSLVSPLANSFDNGLQNTILSRSRRRLSTKVN